MWVFSCEPRMYVIFFYHLLTFLCVTFYSVSYIVHILAQRIGNGAQEEVETSACDATAGKSNAGTVWLCFGNLNNLF